MKKSNSFPTILGVIFLVTSIVIGIILVQGRTIFKLGATAGNEPKEVRVTNITDNSFTVTWTTDLATQGFVKFGENQGSLNQSALNEIDSPGTTHYVNVKALKPITDYYFVINSQGTEYDKNGSLWTTTTGASISNPESTVIISGTVTDESKQPVENAIVHAQVLGASSLSTLTSSDGKWLITLSFARDDATLSTHITVDPQKTPVELFVQSSGKTASAKVFPITANPSPPLILGQVQDFTSLSQSSSSSTTPNANLDLPTEIARKSKFDVNEASSSSQTLSVTLESHTEGEIVSTTTPEFFGEGPAGTTLTITVESDPITDTIAIGNKGDWKWDPPTGLAPGSHKITINWRDAQGILRTLTRSFVVQASEAPAFVASSSASTTPTPSSTPKPTATPSATPAATASVSATPVATATAVPLPISGDLTPTLTLTIMGLGVLLFSVIVSLMAF